MRVDTNEAQVGTLEQVRQVLAHAQALEFKAAADDAGRYGWVEAVLTKTQPGKSTKIGVRKAPAPEGRPGFIRIDSVHQGDLDGSKGLYHINAVDCVTQWQVVASVQTISEAHLLSVFEQMLAQFPFEILGFHADNGLAETKKPGRIKRVYWPRDAMTPLSQTGQRAPCRDVLAPGAVAAGTAATGASTDRCAGHGPWTGRRCA